MVKIYIYILSIDVIKFNKVFTIYICFQGIKLDIPFPVVLRASSGIDGVGQKWNLRSSTSLKKVSR